MDWFYTFRDKDEWIVMGGSALEHIKNDLRDPNAQRPSITLFIGNETKTAAQKSMFPANSFSVSSGEGVARLYAESSTTDGVEPRLIGDISVCSSSSGCNNSYRPPRDQPNLVHYRIEWPLAQSHGLSHDCVMNATLSQVVFMFVDVVCLFLDDFATQKDGLDFFERWIKPQGRFWKWKPKVIVVTNREPVPNIEEARQVTLIAKPSNTSIYRSLQKSILHDLNIVRRDRNACRMAFSATHLVAFFELALRHISKSVIEKFDFIHASRQFNEIDERFESHLTNFLRLCFKNSASNQFSIRYIASAMVMDSFPPGMHRK
jgi:hypothetical protein